MKHLLNYHDVVVYPSDLALLESPTAWLNDTCIHFQLTRLQRTPHGSQSTRDAVERWRKRQDTGVTGDGDGDDHVNPLGDLYVDP